MDKSPVNITTNMTLVNPTFSIIIPHKDIPDLLVQCRKSIPVSDDIQVIVVDIISLIPGSKYVIG